MASQDSQSFHWHGIELDKHDFKIHGRTLFYVVVLFSVALLVTLVFLYTRWVCRYHHHHFPSTPTNRAPHALPPTSYGLNPMTAKALPITLHKATLGSSNGTIEETECCICLGGFEDGDKVKVLPQCGHSFHCDCVDRWLTTQSSCPLCRASLRLDLEVAIIIE